MIFESRYTWLQAIGRTLGIGIAMMLMVWIYYWSEVPRTPAPVLLAPILLLWFGITAQLRLPTVLVTDRRILYRSGLFRCEVADIPLDCIEEFREVPGIFGFGEHVCVRENANRRKLLIHLPRPQDLMAELSSLTGRPPPFEFSSLIKNVYNFAFLAVVGCGFGGILLVGYMAFHVVGPDPLEIGNKLAAVYLLIFLLFFPMLVPAVVLSCLVGCIPAFFAARFLLTPEEAEQLLRIGQASYEPGMARAFSRRTRQLFAWVLSRLYGQTIRCD